MSKNTGYEKEKVERELRETRERIKELERNLRRVRESLYLIRAALVRVGEGVNSHEEVNKFDHLIATLYDKIGEIRG